MNVERSLPLDLEDHAHAVNCLVDRFSREPDSVVRAKIASLLGQLGKAAGLKANDLTADVTRMLKTESTCSVESCRVRTGPAKSWIAVESKSQIFKDCES